MSGTTHSRRNAILAAAILIVIGGAVALGLVLGRGGVFIALGGGALLLSVWLLWESVQSLTGAGALTLEEAVGLGAPSVEEERKQSVLRVLKDLEYERSVGKLSEPDYQQLSKKYRTEARRLLQLLDENLAEERERAEALLQERLAQLQAAADSSDTAVDAVRAKSDSEGANAAQLAEESPAAAMSGESSSSEASEPSSKASKTPSDSPKTQVQTANEAEGTPTA